MPHETVELTLDGVIDLLQSELDDAADALSEDNLGAALDGYAAALGIALQLGPAPTERVLRTVLQSAQVLAGRAEADALAALGPAMAGLVGQVREAGVLPATPVMEAWVAVIADLGALIGQIGVALTLPTQHRAGMLDSARARAALLDDATAGLFSLATWLDEMAPG